MPVVAGDEVVALSKACRQVYISPVIETYLLSLVRATRSNPALSLGASPRGSLALARTAQVLAAVRGRAFVIPDDVQWLAGSALTHRLILSQPVALRGKGVPEVLQSVIEQVPVPVEESWSNRRQTFEGERSILMTSRFSQVAIVVLLFIGLLAHSPLLLLLDVLLLIVFGSSWLWGATACPMSVMRAASVRCGLFCGEEADLWIEVVNAKLLPFALAEGRG